MMLTPTLTLSVFAMLTSQARLSERALADIAAIGIPRDVKEEMYKGVRENQAGRITFTFATSYFWASFGSSTAYKHLLAVSLMAPDATNAEYDAMPTRLGLLYDNRKVAPPTPLGTGTLTVIDAVYVQNSLKEPAHTFIYADRTRRLQIAWHAVKSEVDLASAKELLGRMAASFRIIRDPAATFAGMEHERRKAADERVRNRTIAMETLEREGYGPLEPGKPVFKNDVYVEWMSDPEPRFQLLLPLGRVRVAANATPGTRPRSRSREQVAPAGKRLNGTIGWREFRDGEWEFSNPDNAYLPFKGIAATLAAEAQDPAFVYFYYSSTIRVEESTRMWLTSLSWFFDTVPEARRLWQEGKLVTGGTP